MTETGFFAQKRQSPGGFALVLLLHGAVFAAVVMIKGPQFFRDFHPPTKITFIDPIDPPPEPTPPEPRVRQPQQTPISQTDPIVPTQTSQQTVTTVRDPGPIQIANLGGTIVTPPVLPDPPPAPVRRAAELDPRYASALQPPYPPSEIRAQRNGRVQVRVTIGPDGRVIGVSQISATSPAFWAVTEQQARRWRFRPATVDGRPVQDSKVMTLVFRIEDAA